MMSPQSPAIVVHRIVVGISLVRSIGTALSSQLLSNVSAWCMGGCLRGMAEAEREGIIVLLPIPPNVSYNAVGRMCPWWAGPTTVLLREYISAPLRPAGG